MSNFNTTCSLPIFEFTGSYEDFSCGGSVLLSRITSCVSTDVIMTEFKRSLKYSFHQDAPSTLSNRHFCLLWIM